MLHPWILPAVFAFGVALVVTRALVPLLQSRGVLDVPTDRSSHDAPVPRGGGIGLLAGIAAGALVAGAADAAVPGPQLWLALAIVAGIGWLDDRVTGGLPPSLRLLVQTAAATLAVVGTGGLDTFPLPDPANFATGVLAYPLAMLWIVAVTNFYNFLDGIDGYAGAQGLLAGVGLLLVAGLEPAAGLGAVIAGACAGFLVSNWHPARIFMGDVGSASLGFLLAAMPFHALALAPSDLVPLVALTLWFFLADGVYTLVRRAARRERVWEAHRSHVYQRLHQSGLRHDEVVLRLIGRATIVAALAVAAVRFGEAGARWAVLAVALLLFVGVVLRLHARERAVAARE